MCQESLCPNAHVLTIEHVLAHIVPEHVYAIVMLFILDLRPSFMFHHLVPEQYMFQTYGRQMKGKCFEHIQNSQITSVSENRF